MADSDFRPQWHPRPPPPSGNVATVTQSLVVAFAVIAALYFGREVFVPLALAVLLSFALGPLVIALRRIHFGRVGSVAAAVLFAFIVIFGASAIIATQLTGLAGNLPRYQYNITEKIASIKHATAGAGLMQRASTMLSALRSEMTRVGPEDAVSPATVVAPSAIPSAPTSRSAFPLPVEIYQPDPAPLQMIQEIAGPLLEPLSTSLIVIVFVVLFLLQREDLRDRFIRLAGARDLRRTTEALDDATRRLSRYLLLQSTVNGCFGVFIGVGLWIIGVPNPLLWGVLAMILRFVPYIGPIIAAAFPAALALAVDPDWSMLLWTLALFFIAEPIVGQIIEPMLYGHNTGISPVAIVIAAVFWTWLWGLVGLLLATPLTVCLVVLGRHVEGLGFLDILLGDRPALAPDESFYQRVLAGDPAEAADQAEEFLKTRRLADYYDEVALKGLALAQADVTRGTLDHERRVQITEAIQEVIDDLADHDDVEPGDDTPAAAATQPEEPFADIPAAWRDNAVICVAGRGSIDEVSATMLAQLLNKHGVGARVVPSVAVSASNVLKLDLQGVQLAIVCFMAPGGFSSARFMVRRLRRAGRAKVVIGFWTLGDEPERQKAAMTATAADQIVTSMRGAVAYAIEAAHAAAATAPHVVNVATPVMVAAVKAG